MKKKKIKVSKGKFTLKIQKIILFDDSELYDENYDSSINEKKLDKFIEIFSK